ncbi:MAG: hypothetical protein C4541_03560 [Candidatus Auribacter fodinae]|jgi:glycosyltransferase involved in cell wall biosynthesis|uniref:Glycosyltransferase subfamily 4-like N-terminal domain-containing protein n=1 Tax=Candidatus Auribacter fodinae TaxID=2093366 RepID=A0A3A4R3T5_9BACT|nr:MAG: hypothetical protein C4541_03560 [Candidatus Auribacter fodinae]
MAKRKVLFISYFCPPFGGGGVLRSTKFIKYLPEYGYEPIVITAKENALGAKDFSLLSELPTSVRIYREGAITPFFLFRALKKLGLNSVRRYLDKHFCIPDKLVGWVPFALRRAKKILKDEHIDLIFTSSPPHSQQIIGRKLKKMFPHIPWVADFRDAWCENPFRDVDPGQLREQIEQKLERKVLRKADALIFNTHSSLNVYRRKYGNIIQNKSFVIPNGFDKADFQISSKPHNLQYTIVHTGDIYGIRSLKPFIQALHMFQKRHKKEQQKLRIVFIGYYIKPEDKEFAAECGVEHFFEFKDFLPHEQCVKEMMNADLLLLVTGRGEHEVMIPGKFYEYLGAQVPILALAEKGELTKILQECNAGDWAPPDNPDKIYQILCKYLSNRKNKTFFHPNYEMVMRFDRKALTGQLASIFTNLLI